MKALVNTFSKLWDFLKGLFGSKNQQGNIGNKNSNQSVNGNINGDGSGNNFNNSNGNSFNIRKDGKDER